MSEIISSGRSVDDPSLPGLHVSAPLSSNRDTVSPNSSTSLGGFGLVAFESTIDDTATPSSVTPHADHHRREWRGSMRRVEAEVYYDSRAATKKEFRRRASTLQEYYKENPNLLPQLPFTWHHGVRRFRLGAVIIVMWIDACIVPIALCYGLYYGGDVETGSPLPSSQRFGEVPHISSSPSEH